MSDSPEMVPVRRKDRVVTDEAWIEEMLAQAPFGVLATVRDGQPFVNMNIFAYESAGHVIWMHSANTGQTRDLVALGGRISFCVSEMGRLLPAPHARNFSVEYTGVVVYGSAEIVADENEARHGLQLLLNKYAPHLRPGIHYRPITSEEIAQTAVYRIRIERWSGKRKIAPADHPGAFRYGEPAAPPWADWHDGVPKESAG